jgi:hypothetical protein
MPLRLDKPTLNHPGRIVEEGALSALETPHERCGFGAVVEQGAAEIKPHPTGLSKRLDEEIDLTPHELPVERAGRTREVFGGRIVGEASLGARCRRGGHAQDRRNRAPACE